MIFPLKNIIDIMALCHHNSNGGTVPQKKPQLREQSGHMKHYQLSKVGGISMSIITFKSHITQNLMALAPYKARG